MVSQGSQPGTSATGESSPQGPTESARREKRPAESVVDSEEVDLETVQLLDAAEALDLVEFDPSVNDTGEWEAFKTMSTFLQKHFNRSGFPSPPPPPQQDGSSTAPPTGRE